MSPGLRPAAAGAPPRSCAVETSCHRGRAPLRQTLAVAPRHPAALQRRSLDAPWHTPCAEIVRLRGVPINRDAGEMAQRHRRPPRAAVGLLMFGTRLSGGFPQAEE